MALFEAFIKAMRNAPVKLAPKPIRIATAGKIIIDVTARPVPSNKAVLLCFEAMIKTSNEMKLTGYLHLYSTRYAKK